MTGPAVIVGTGPGFGHALASRLAAAGHKVVLIARRTSRLDEVAARLRTEGAEVHTLAIDATDERQVRDGFETIRQSVGIPSLVVYSIEETVPGQALEITAPAFEDCWRSNCLGAFLVCSVVARQMLENRNGTILIIGSTSSIVGRERHLSQAVGKFGRRALAQVMARELWPRGIHVAHVLIDAEIDEDPGDRGEGPRADPRDIADALLAIHRQGRSAWTFEVDLRPYDEQFWNHC